MPKYRTRTLIVMMLVAVGMTLLALRLLPSRMTQWLQPHTEQGVSHQRESQAIGYTDYTTTLAASKEILAAQAHLLTAKVTRNETTTQTIERVVMPSLSKKLASKASLAIHYRVEYAFGYDLQAGNVQYKSTAQGIEIHVNKPKLLTQPAVTELSHEILSKGLLTDEEAAALKLYEQAAEQAARQGEILASDPAIMALCEKQLIGFISDLLSKQPHLTPVPQIRVVYR